MVFFMATILGDVQDSQNGDSYQPLFKAVIKLGRAAELSMEFEDRKAMGFRFYD